MTLVEFLLARIAEDEACARAAVPGPWDSDGVEEVFGGPDDDTWPITVAIARAWPNQPPGKQEANGDHIARWDPARVLAECEAKRRIVEDVAENYLDHAGGIESTDGLAWRALEYLALPYADHPDYRQEWRP